MANSLHEQFLKAGLVNSKQAKKAKEAKYQQQKQQKRGKGKADNGDDAAQVAARVQAEQRQRAQELNQQQKEIAARKALEGQIRQLIEQHRLPRDEGDLGYHFEHEKKIRKLFVSESVAGKLGRGQLAIVTLGEQYEIVPANVAEKIRQRDASRVITLNKETQTAAADDPYADYQVPDDLMW